MSEENDSTTPKRLWAPWRLEYVKALKHLNTTCPFCELPKEEPSEKNLVLYRDEEIFVIMNKFPYNPGHLMVIPRKHAAKPHELEAAIWMRLSRGVQVAIELVTGLSNPPGFNVGLNLGTAAGAGISEHLHWHIVPRWAGDTNFMPVIAETKTLPQHNLAVYNDLKPLFAGFGAKLGTIG